MCTALSACVIRTDCCETELRLSHLLLYFIFILKKEKWILCGYKVLALECVAADT